MKKLIFLLLFPVSVFSQTLQEVDFVAKGYYKVIVSDTLYSQHQNQKECLQQVTNLLINNISSHCEQPWIDVIGEFSETVTDSFNIINVESLTLRQVNWSFQNISGERKFSYQAEAYGDSVRFEYFHNADLIRSSTQIPANGAVHDTLINPPNDSLQIWIYGYWDKWVEPFHEIVDIALSDTLGGEEPSDTTETTMALPSTAYAIASFTNPASALTDFTGLVDLSKLPQSWWDEVTSSDGTRGRVAKDDETELASDWIEFDDVAQTGFVRFLWSGTLASTGTQEVRVYPPQTGNDAYANTDTFGQYNAYNSGWEGYYPDGGTTDRTSNQNNGTANGGVTIGEATGKVGSATEFDGTDDYVRISSAVVTSSPVLVIAWASTDDLDNQRAAFSIGNDSSTGDGFELGVNVSGKSYWFARRSTSAVATGPTDLSIDTWYHISGSSISDRHEAYTDGVIGDGLTTGRNPNGLNHSAIGARSRTGQSNFFDGHVQEVQVHSVDRGDDWISLEYQQTNDPATFWGTWTVEGGGGETLEMDKGTFSLSGKDLFTNLSTPLNKGTFNLTGRELLQNLSVPLDKGTFSQQGYALSFGLSIPVDKGTFSQTGYDLVFNRSVPLDKGSFTLDGKTLNLNLSVPIGKGTFDLTGYDVEFGGQNTLVMGSGSFSVDGKDLSFQFTHVLDKGSFSVDGKNVNFNTSIPLEKSNFNLDGKELSFNHVVPLDKGEFDLTGYQLIFDAVDNIVLLSGNSLISDITGSSTISDITGSSTIRDITGDSTL